MPPKDEKDAGGRPRAEAELEPTAGEEVGDDRVLGDADDVLQRKGDHAGRQPDAAGLRGKVAEKDEGRGQPALVGVEVVLGDPDGVETELLGMPCLFAGEPVPVGGVRLSSSRVKNPSFTTAIHILLAREGSRTDRCLS